MSEKKVRKNTMSKIRVEKTYAYDKDTYTWMDDGLLDDFEIEDENCDLGSEHSETENEINPTYSSGATVSVHKYLHSMKTDGSFASKSNSSFFSSLSSNLNKSKVVKSKNESIIIQKVPVKKD